MTKLWCACAWMNFIVLTCNAQIFTAEMLLFCNHKTNYIDTFYYVVATSNNNVTACSAIAFMKKSGFKPATSVDLQTLRIALSLDGIDPLSRRFYAIYATAALDKPGLGISKIGVIPLKSCDSDSLHAKAVEFYDAAMCGMMSHNNIRYYPLMSAFLAKRSK